MSGVTLKVTGLDEILRSLNVDKMEPEISDELAAFGLDVVRDAKDLVPVDEGFLKNSINSVPEKLKVTVVVNADYAAYVEFGTRKFAASRVATLPPNWQAFAAQFKGSGSGSFQEFMMSIIGWCKRKGIPENAAYPIAKSIMINGIKPHPYLFPSFEIHYPKLLERLNNLFK